jgi:hypothetical protein
MDSITRLVAVVCLLVATSASPSEHRPPTERQLRRIVAVLTKGSDADSLAAAGLLSLPAGRNLIEKAAALAPDRPDLLWLYAQVCQEAPACDPEPTERRLRALDPSNGYGWMGALVRANNEETRDAALLSMSHSERIDIYWTTLIARLTRATVRTQKVTLRDAEDSIAGTLAARDLHAFVVASNACKGDRLQQPGVMQVCRNVAQAFAHADTYIAEMMGSAMIQRLWPEGSAEWKAAAEARRVFEYRWQWWRSLVSENESQAQMYLRLCEENLREQDLFAAQLALLGKDPNPPAVQ